MISFSFCVVEPMVSEVAHGPGWASRILLGICMQSTDLGARRELEVNHQVTERRESKSRYREINELLWWSSSRDLVVHLFIWFQEPLGIFPLNPFSCVIQHWFWYLWAKGTSQRLCHKDVHSTCTRYLVPRNKEDVFQLLKEFRI